MRYEQQKNTGLNSINLFALKFCDSATRNSQYWSFVVRPNGCNNNRIVFFRLSALLSSLPQMSYPNNNNIKRCVVFASITCLVSISALSSPSLNDNLTNLSIIYYKATRGCSMKTTVSRTYIYMKLRFSLFYEIQMKSDRRLLWQICLTIRTWLLYISEFVCLLHTLSTVFNEA